MKGIRSIWQFPIDRTNQRYIACESRMYPPFGLNDSGHNDMTVPTDKPSVKAITCQ